ncbi:SusC/RagA family TonB-linked outer membrane protein [Flavobacterium franklandianum]|uniref:SusC/RagA family TonB-linked outer membrane protein n=1 Tax=Flavobacterium franklandianum TaxID=2594430 RepID=A0A553CM95_9FLAO|nr:SusC/RagA family TonB-linked outer membrane protein [Flavobacterium franklandianum]TRX21656.1 SusC/RagA family TonB-linked outer membrane protein [Flavobacterium franklandianum]
MNSKNKKTDPLQNRSTKLVILITFMLFLSIGMYAQEKKVKGTVYDKTGEALPGVSILEIGTKNSTLTDFSGKFVLEMSKEGTIQISYMGYITQSIPVNASTVPSITVSLKDDTFLLEAVVVSVGYGTVKKSDLTGAITSISSKDLVKGVITSTEQALQGKVAGLAIVQGSGDPSSGSTMRIRGGTSLTASNNPLVVVDGVAGVDINVIQPSDIKSIDVLKDASATAIYGSRGANGVIIITTKAGTKTSTVVYNGFTGVGFTTNHVDMLSANQWRGYVRDNQLTNAVDYGATTNWQKELEQTAYTSSHTLSLSSSNEMNGIRSSVSYLDNEGVIKESGLKRLSGNISGHQYALNKAIKFDTGIFATFDKWNPIDYRIFQRAYNLNPTIPVYNQNGEFTSIGGTIYENPVEILTNRTANNKRTRLLGYFKTEANFLTDFNAVLNVSSEYNGTQTNTYKPTYAVMEGTTQVGYAQKTYGEYITSQAEAYLNYTKVLGKNNIGVMGGYSYLENTYEGFGAQRQGFVTDLFGYNNLGAGSDYQLGDVYSYKGKSNLISLFARANYSYDSRYMITGTIRRDGSSRFGENNKWGVFPSAAVAWNITNEPFMKSTEKWLSNLKFRVSYGVTGNQDGIGEYKSLSLLGVGNDSYYDPVTDSWSLAYSPKQNANPDLKWESTAQTNIGVDFSLFKRLTGSIDVYSKLTSDLLYTYEVPQPPYLVGTMLANVGELSNKGYEIALNASIVDTKDFTIDANLTFSQNKQKIEKLSNANYETDIILSGSLHGLPGMSGQYSQIIAEGYPVGTFWGYESSGLDENGEFILADEKSALGDIQPDFNLGLGVNMTYKNFDFQASGYGMFGQKVLNATNMILYDPLRMPSNNVPDDFLNSGIESPPTYSSHWIEDASFFRVQNLTLGYTVPMKNKDTSLRLFVIGQNLFVFTKYSGVDPEIGLNAYDGQDQTGLASPGIDKFNNYPRPTTVSLGLFFTLKN